MVHCHNQHQQGESILANQSNRLLDATQRSEESLVSGLIVDPAKMAVATEHVTAGDFVSSGLGLVFATIKAMIDGNIPTDSSTIAGELHKSGAIDAVGGVVRIGEWLRDGTILSAHVAFHAGEVARYARARRMKSALSSALQTLENPKADPTEVADEVQRALEGCQVSDADIETDRAICLSRLDELEIMRQAGTPSLLSTGFPCIDRALRGGLPVGTTILAAATSIGKTELSLEIASKVALRGDPVLFVSLEMTKKQIADRRLSKLSGVSGHCILQLTYTDTEATRLYQSVANGALETLHNWECPGSKMASIESKVQAMKAKHGIKLVIIDYLGLIQPANARAKPYEYVTEHSLAVARMAKRLGVPTLLLCQLNRDWDESDPPSLRNLRDSGAIEQDADVVTFLHRDRNVDPNTNKPSKEASFIVAKNRQGEIANTKLHFEGGHYGDPSEAFSNDFKGFGGGG